MAKDDRWMFRIHATLCMTVFLGVIGSGCSDAPTDTTGGGGTGNPHTCDAPRMLCGEVCVDPRVETANCGSCGNDCELFEVCVDGMCKSVCPDGTTECRLSCVDLSTDSDNCGSCDTTCTTTEVCIAGKCESMCMGTMTPCGNMCVDTSNDSTNCGACGTVCNAPEVCVAGKCELVCLDALTPCGNMCVDTSNDSTNCGACGTVCNMGQVCSMGMCSLPPATYFKASNTGEKDSFGLAVALSGDGNTLAISAYGEDSNATGIGGNQADDSAIDAGAVYIFTNIGGVWSQQAYIKASNAGAGDRFGLSIALSTDGNTLAVGASDEDSGATGINGNGADDTVLDSGAAYVFTRSGTVWSQQAYIKASNTGSADYFGAAVSLSGDGNTLAVGARYEDSNATGINGNQSNDLADGSGAAYVFLRNGTAWTQQAYIKASNTQSGDWFAWAVSLARDGNTLAVGAHNEDSNATGINGNQGDDTAVSAGAAYVYARNGGTWSQQAYVKASNTDAGDRFGYLVTLSSDGNTLAVGAPYEDSNATGINGNQSDNSAIDAGAAYVFLRNGGVWNQQAYIKPSNAEAGDNFGWVVSLADDGNTLALGSITEDSSALNIGGNDADNTAIDAGAAYMFMRSGGAWSQQAYVKASNTGAGDWFGRAGCLSADGKTLVIGAYQEDSNATGINGNQSDDSMSSAGAGYLYSF